MLFALLSIAETATAGPDCRSMGKGLKDSSLAFQHSLSVEEAKERIDQLFIYWKRRYKVTFEWSGDFLDATWELNRKTYHGRLVVKQGIVEMTFEPPPYAMRPFACRYVSKKFRKYLSSAYFES